MKGLRGDTPHPDAKKVTDDLLRTRVGVSLSEESSGVVCAPSIGMSSCEPTFLIICNPEGNEWTVVIRPGECMGDISLGRWWGLSGGEGGGCSSILSELSLNRVKFGR